MEIFIILVLIVLHGFLVLGEIALITAKRAKLEAENKTLRIGNNQGKRIKDLEDEVEALKVQLQ